MIVYPNETNIGNRIRTIHSEPGRVFLYDINYIKWFEIEFHLPVGGNAGD